MKSPRILIAATAIEGLQRTFVGCFFQDQLMLCLQLLFFLYFCFIKLNNPLYFLFMPANNFLYTLLVLFPDIFLRNLTMVHFYWLLLRTSQVQRLDGISELGLLQHAPQLQSLLLFSKQLLLFLPAALLQLLYVFFHPLDQRNQVLYLFISQGQLIKPILAFLVHLLRQFKVTTMQFFLCREALSQFVQFVFVKLQMFCPDARDSDEVFFLFCKCKHGPIFQDPQRLLKLLPVQPVHLA